MESELQGVQFSVGLQSEMSWAEANGTVAERRARAAPAYAEGEGMFSGDSARQAREPVRERVSFGRANEGRGEEGPQERAMGSEG